MFLVFLTMPSVLGVSIGVSPGRIEFKNMLKDGYAEQYVTISTSIPEDVRTHYEVSGEVKNWLRFDPPNESFVMSKTKPYKLKIIATTPSDAATRTYVGEITFVTDALAGVSGGMGSAVRAAIISKTVVDITDKQILMCRAGGLDFKDTEEGKPIEFYASVYNDGNVRLRPVFVIEVWDQMQENIIFSKELVGDEILPTTRGEYLFEIENNLKIGQYWVNVLVRSEDVSLKDCWVSDFLTFSVFERGTILDKGVLEKVSSKTWAFVGEIIPITALFRNEGEKSVDARFKGKITLEDEIVEVLESDELRVLPGESVELTTYFTPKEAGRYVVTGRVLYNNKLTFEKGTIINVNYAQRFEGIKLIPIFSYILILVIILFLIYKIRKERKKANRWKRTR